MNVVFAQERRPNIVDDLLNVIRNSEARREIAERENMQLREDNRRLNTQVRQLMQTIENIDGPATFVMGRSPPIIPQDCCIDMKLLAMAVPEQL